MPGQSTYRCVASLPAGVFDASAELGRDAIELAADDGSRHELPYADIMDMRLLNYHLRLSMRGYDAEVSKLGYQTEDFFEKLWQAYGAKSERSLFVESDLVMRGEGDYAYAEPGVEKHGIAKLALYEDCLCIMPHDVGGRRVPLCFAEPPGREGFALSTRLDTGEAYRVARLGSDTDPFFRKLTEAREAAVARWQDAHRTLEANLASRLGDFASSYEAFCALGADGCAADVARGLFSADDEAFWFAAIADGRAAVELVTDEKAATYLYRFDVSRAAFESSLRHAMEAMKTNRRVIYVEEDELAREPLFRMAVDRSPHVRLLRACNAGRIIHTANWSSKLSEFFG